MKKFLEGELLGDFVMNFVEDMNEERKINFKLEIVVKEVEIKLKVDSLVLNEKEELFEGEEGDKFFDNIVVNELEINLKGDNLVFIEKDVLFE